MYIHICIYIHVNIRTCIVQIATNRASLLTHKHKMCVPRYIYMSTYIHTHTYTYIYVYICIHIYIYIYLYIYIYIYINASICIHDIYIHVYVCVSVYLSVCLLVYVRVYVYVCVCAYVSRADCDEEGNKAMCGKVGVRGYPTLKIYPVSLLNTSTKTPYTTP